MTVISYNDGPRRAEPYGDAEFAASPERVWEVWENPRQLERWWGPPTYPATFTRHDFVVGGESRYFMTGPEARNRRVLADARHRRAATPRVRERSRGRRR